MKEYLWTLFGVCATSAIVGAISPEGAMKKYISILCSLCVTVAVISPLISEISSLDDIGELLELDVGYDATDYEEIYNGYLLEQNLSLACETLEAELAERFSVENGELTVALEAVDVDGEISVSSATVYIGLGAVTVDPAEIKAYMLERTGCECEIIYNFKGE